MMHEPLPTFEEQIRAIARDEAQRVALEEIRHLHAILKPRPWLGGDGPRLLLLALVIVAGTAILAMALMTASAEGASLTVSATVVGPCGAQPCPDFREAPPPPKPEE